MTNKKTPPRIPDAPAAQPIYGHLQETILGETNEDEDAYKCPNMRPGNMAVAVLAVAALVVACVVVVLMVVR